METVAERFDTTLETLRAQMGAFAERTLEAQRTFASQTREASTELFGALGDETRAWTSLLGTKAGALRSGEPAGARLSAMSSAADLGGLERRLLVGMRDVVARVDARLQARLDDRRALTAQEPPLDGYDELSAKDIVSRVADLEPQVVEAVAAYEASHKARKTVLQATTS